MAPNNRWSSREGFTADVLGRIIKRTALAPSLTLPLLLLAKYTSKGRDLSAKHARALQILKILVSLGLARWVNGWITRRALNNGVSDKYVWYKEVAVVTGGSDGIGKRITLMLAHRGIKVVVLDVQPLKYRAPSNVYYFNCDICSNETVSAVAAEVREKVGAPTILINNAGILKGKTLLEGTEADTRQTFEVNTLSHYWLAREFLPNMIEKNHGMVVTVASQAGYIVTPHLVDYSSSKAAAIAFHEGVATELRTRYNAPKVRTVLVTQGFARTFLSRNLSADDTWFNPLLEPETVAELVVKQILTGSSGHIVVPSSTGFLAQHIRSFPYWFQNNLRNSCEKLMRPRGT